MSTPSLDLAGIAEAIAAQLTTADTGVHGYWHEVPHPQYPAVFVLPGVDFVEYFSTSGGSGRSTLQWELRLLVPVQGATESPTLKMLSLLSIGTDDSLFDAIYADLTFGGAVETTRPPAVTTTPRIEPTDTQETLVARLLLTQIVKKGA